MCIVIFIIIIFSPTAYCKKNTWKQDNDTSQYPPTCERHNIIYIYGIFKKQTEPRQWRFNHELILIAFKYRPH